MTAHHNESNKLDIAERIARAVHCETEPRPFMGQEFDPETETKVGEVPKHLQHVYNLLEDLTKEKLQAENDVEQAKLVLEQKKKLHRCTYCVFHYALEEHLSNDGEFDTLNIRQDGVVAAYNKN